MRCINSTCQRISEKSKNAGIAGEWFTKDMGHKPDLSKWGNTGWALEAETAANLASVASWRQQPPSSARHASGSASLTGWLCSNSFLSLQCPPLALNLVTIIGPNWDTISSVPKLTVRLDPFSLMLFQHLYLYQSLISHPIQTVYCIIVSSLFSLLQKDHMPLSNQGNLFFFKKKL